MASSTAITPLTCMDMARHQPDGRQEQVDEEVAATAAGECYRSWWK